MRRAGIARRTGIIILLVAVLVVGFLLPTIVGTVQENQTNETRQVVQANSVQLEMSSALTVLQKLRIAAEETSSTVEVESAPNMEEGQALDTLLAGLQELFDMNLMGVPLTVDGFSEVSHQIIIKMSGEDSLIYWEFWLSDLEGNQITAALDDDTGLILSLQYTFSQASEEEENVEPTAPLGLPLFLQQELPVDEAGTFSEQGIFAVLEENGSSAENFLAMVARQYCGRYLRSLGESVSWEVDTSEAAEAAYDYSVMMVDNDGGYYVLPFTMTSYEITMN